MEMFKKIGRVLATLIPTNTMSFTKEKGAYMLVSTHVWMDKTTVEKAPIKDLVGK